MARENPLILIVDDDTGSQTLMRLILNRSGYTNVTTAWAAVEARPLLKQLPDLILCDIIMPGMDGFQFFAEIKADRTLDGVRFAFISTKGDVETVGYGLAMQADAYIALPIHHLEFVKRVKSILEQPTPRRSLPTES